MEPWDGPVMVAFSDGRYIGATLVYVRAVLTNEDHVYILSEISVCPELKDTDVKIKQSLERGKMFICRFRNCS